MTSENIIRFVNQSEVDEELLKYDSGVVSEGNIVGYAQNGAERTFSIGQPMYDKDGNLMGYLGIGLYRSLNYVSPIPGIEIPVEHWQIMNPTKFCKVGKNVFTYWQNKKRKGAEK